MKRREFRRMAVVPKKAHPQYYKVKAAELQFRADSQAVVEQLKAEMNAQFKSELDTRVQPLRNTLDRVLKAAGLDPAKNYVLTDETESITET